MTQPVMAFGAPTRPVGHVVMGAYSEFPIYPYLGPQASRQIGLS